MSANLDNVTEIFPPKGLERIARTNLSIEQDGRFFIANNREDEAAVQMKRMFGSEAARRRRESGPAIETPVATPYTTTLAADPSVSPPKRANSPSLEDILLGENTKTWSLMAGISHPAYEAGETFTISAAALDRKTATLRVSTDGQHGEKSLELTGDPANLKASLDEQLAKMLAEAAAPEIETVVSQTLETESSPTEIGQQPDIDADVMVDAADPTQELFDSVIANTGGAAGPAVEWLGETLDRPQTAAKSGMRAVITSSGIQTGVAGSKTLKMVLDYQPYAAHNAAIANGGRVPRTFEMIQVSVSAAEGGDNSALAQKVSRIFQKIETPTLQVDHTHVSAKEMRTTDERLKLAELANTVVIQQGQVPPSPLPPVNPSPVASRVYFWTAKEEGKYCFRDLIKAAQAEGIPLLVNRNKNDPEHWGLRYAELTREDVEKLPASLTTFLTPAAQEAHLESKRLRDSSRQVIADAAATAAIEVTSRKPDYRDEDIRPITVPHPNLDASGWEAARGAIYNMPKDKLQMAMDLTWARKNELEIENDKLATMGIRISRDKESKIAMWDNGLKLGKHVLEKSGITWEAPDQHQEKAATNEAAQVQQMPTPRHAETPEVSRAAEQRKTLSLKPTSQTKAAEPQIQG